MFEIIEEPLNDLQRLKLLNTETGEFVSIIPQFGANVNEIVLQKQGKVHSILEGNESRASFKGKGVFKGAHLLPFPNRIKEGRYTFKGISYQLPLNYPDEGHAAHGFIYNKPFELTSTFANPTFARATLQYHYDGNNKGYPFPLNIQIIYQLEEKNGFQCQVEVTNIGEQAIPFGCGWHPFFKLGRKIDQLNLKFSADRRIIFDSQLIPTGQTEKFAYFKQLKRIGNHHFDACFKLQESTTNHQTELFDEQKDLKIILWQETGPSKFNYLQVYTPPNRQSIALEPMTCNVDAFNNGQGLIILKPQQKFSAKFGVQLK